MSCAVFQGRALAIDDVPLADVAARFGTPVYVYGAAEIRRRYRRLSTAFGDRPPLICYALKANPTLGIVALLAQEGAGADVVSAGELARALKAGIPAARIVFAGVGKSDAEIDAGLDADILQFNVEAIEELPAIAARAAARGRGAPVALRLNPDVAASTHDKISTGRRHDKFGIAGERLDEALDAVAAHDGLQLVGLHCHIGSQIAAVADFERAYRRMGEFWRHVRSRGFAPVRLNLGGGLGIRYVDEHELDIADFARMALQVTADLDADLVFEPGRYLVAAAGVLVSRVVRVKSGSDGRRFVIVDAGMNTLVRPAMYGAVHPVVPLVRQRDAAAARADVVGPICESSDVFARDLSLPPLEEGDLVAFTNTGAYGAAMASDYNSRGRPAEVLVDGHQVELLKPALAPMELAADEVVPDRLRRR